MAAVTHAGSIGQHEVRRTGDLVALRIRGPLTIGDLRRLREVLVAVMAERGHCFLVADMREATAIDHDTRKYMADWSRESTDWVAGAAIHGVSFAMRALLTLTLKAIKILGTQQVELVFVKDEPDALRWIDDRRRALFPAAAHDHE